MRVVLAAMLIAVGLAVHPMYSLPAHADSGNCPPMCDRIPDAAWIDPHSVPLDSVYRWPAPADVAVPTTGTMPRFRFEELCNAPRVPGDPRDYAVAGRTTVTHPEGQWQLQVQILHWRGDTSSGGQNAVSAFNAALAALRACQAQAPLESPSITTDEPNRLAAVISGPAIMHTYLVAHPQSSTISELALWSSAPSQLPWPPILDAGVLDAMAAPLCVAYIGSCP